MINPIVEWTPTIILITCSSLYMALRSESRKFIEELKELGEEQAKIMKLIFLRKLILFFLESKTSKDADQLLEHVEIFAEKIEEGADNITNDATYEIADLNGYLERIRKNQKNLTSLETLFSILTRIVLAYGIIVAAMQYFIILIYVELPAFAPIKQVNDIMIGATLIFGSVIILLYMDIALRTHALRESKYVDHDTNMSAENTGIELSQSNPR